MHELFGVVASHIGLGIEVIAVLVITVGTLQTFFAAAGGFLAGAKGESFREIWLRYAHWLVAGLTFLLAADLVRTAVAPTWDDIGKLAAIAAIRTALNYFLERDMREIEERGRAEPRLEP